MFNVIKNIQNYASQNNLWEKGSKIVLGVSGGPDSVSLLDIFAKLSKKYDFELHIAHVNYGLRGEDSKKDETFARDLGKQYGIKVSILKPKKSQYKGNLENSLRKIRYDFFEQIRKKIGFNLIAVAHNQDDQAETVLMRIMRGAGLNGLSAMRARTGNIIRPLLKTSRKDILAYIKQNNLKFRIDRSNTSVKFTRNSVRHNLIPYLEKNFNPGIKKTLSEWSAAVADDYDFIKQKAEIFAKGACKIKCAHFSQKAFLNLHPSVQRQVLRSIIVKQKEGTEDIENQHVEEMLKLIKSGKSKAQKAKICGLNISKKGDKVEIN